MQEKPPEKKKDIQELVEETMKREWRCIICSKGTFNRGRWYPQNNILGIPNHAVIYALCEECQRIKSYPEIERKILRQCQ